MASNVPQNLNFKQAVIEGLKCRLESLGSATLKVINCYPATPNHLPCISVTQASGELGPQSIGEDWGKFQDEHGNYWAVDGSFYRQSLEVTLWTHHPDDRDQLSAQTRKALWRTIKQLSDEQNVQEARLSETGDGQDFEAQQPQDVFLFTFTLSALVPLMDTVPIGPPASVEVSLSFVSEDDAQAPAI